MSDTLRQTALISAADPEFPDLLRNGRSRRRRRHRGLRRSMRQPVRQWYSRDQGCGLVDLASSWPPPTCDTCWPELRPREQVGIPATSSPRFWEAPRKNGHSDQPQPGTPAARNDDWVPTVMTTGRRPRAGVSRAARRRGRQRASGRMSLGSMAPGRDDRSHDATSTRRPACRSPETPPRPSPRSSERRCRRNRLGSPPAASPFHDVAVRGLGIRRATVLWQFVPAWSRCSGRSRPSPGVVCTPTSCSPATSATRRPWPTSSTPSVEGQPHEPGGMHRPGRDGLCDDGLRRPRRLRHHRYDIDPNPDRDAGRRRGEVGDLDPGRGPPARTRSSSWSPRPTRSTASSTATTPRAPALRPAVAEPSPGALTFQ